MTPLSNSTAYESPEPSEAPEPSESPEPRESPEPSESPEHSELPEPSEAPEPSESPEPEPPAADLTLPLAPWLVFVTLIATCAGVFGAAFGGLFVYRSLKRNVPAAAAAPKGPGGASSRALGGVSSANPLNAAMNKGAAGVAVQAW